MLAQHEDATHADSQADESAAADPQGLTKDEAFHILQNARRRAVLRYLLARPEERQFRMRDLAEEVAAFEHDTTVQRLTSTERQRVYIALYQSHLPKLDDLGVIDYNQSRGVVEPTPLLGLFDPFLEDGLHGASTHLEAAAATGTVGDDRSSTDRVVGAISGLWNG